MPSVTSDEYSLVAWFGASNVCLAGFADWVFQGLHRQEISAGLNVLWQLLWFAFIVVGVRLGAGITIAGIGLFCSALAVAFVGAVWLAATQRVEKHDWRVSRLWRESRKILRSASALGSGTLLVTVLVWTDTVVVRLMRGEQGVALYAAGNRAALAMAMLASFYVQGAFPMLSMGSSPGPRFDSFFRHCYSDMAIVFLPGTIWAGFYAREIIQLLFKRSEFLAAVSTFRVFQGVFLLTALGNLYGIGVLVAFHRDRDYRKVLVSATVLFVPLCLVATHYLGILGAALAALATQGMLVVMLAWRTMALVNVKHTATILLPLTVGLAVAGISRVAGLALMSSAAFLLIAYTGLGWYRFQMIRRG
jgi:PST family polysaccharide transporter